MEIKRFAINSRFLFLSALLKTFSRCFPGICWKEFRKAMRQSLFDSPAKFVSLWFHSELNLTALLSTFENLWSFVAIAIHSSFLSPSEHSRQKKSLGCFLHIINTLGTNKPLSDERKIKWDKTKGLLLFNTFSSLTPTD
jgi:hypothetical protein